MDIIIIVCTDHTDPRHLSPLCVVDLCFIVSALASPRCQHRCHPSPWRHARPTALKPKFVAVAQRAGQNYTQQGFRGTGTATRRPVRWAHLCTVTWGTKRLLAETGGARPSKACVGARMHACTYASASVHVCT